jgi:sugar phosphate isomerase/epimerase
MTLNPRNRILGIAIITIAMMLSAVASAAPSFFVFDNGVGREIWTPEQQATTLEELGYEGISYNYTNPEDLAIWQRECGKRGLEIVALYLKTTLDPTDYFDPRFKEAIKLLKGTETVVWMTISKSKDAKDPDAAAVRNAREIADLAAEHGVRVALYGHFGFHVETGTDSARIVKLANRPNLGATLNLCHEFLSGKGNAIDETIQTMARDCTLVSINGMDLANKKYITRLDQGNYDIVTFLEKLQAAGYRGPVGLQCYNVPGDLRDNLAANIATWRSIAGQLDKRRALTPPLTPAAGGN